MAINNYLVIGVNPANNEANVPLDKTLVVTFSKGMDVISLTVDTLALREVNGAAVPYVMDYKNESMVAHLTPVAPLKPLTQYQLQVVGTANGIKSIVGDYMSINRTFEFTTSGTVTLTEPVNLRVSVQDGYPTLEWERPAGFDSSIILSYEVHISKSNQASASPVWPGAGDLNQTASTFLNVPRKLKDEGQYYAYVRAINETEKSEYAQAQFMIEAASQVTPIQPSIPSGPSQDIFSFDVVETYPARDSVDITPERVLIQFSSTLGEVTANDVYVLKKAGKKNLTTLDLMTAYGPSESLSAEIEIQGSLLTITAEFENDAEYTVIVRETAKDSSGNRLGVPYHWSFISKYSRLYGDVSLIREDIGSFSESITDKVLYRYLKDSSDYAYQIASLTSSFDESAYAEGSAPYHMHEYVRCRTAYNLLLNTYVQQGGGAGVSSVTLGDLSISKEAGSGGSISSVLSSLESRMKPLLDMMHGHSNRGYAKPQMVVRGENGQGEPDFLTRTEFRELGQ